MPHFYWVDQYKIEFKSDLLALLYRGYRIFGIQDHSIGEPQLVGDDPYEFSE